MLHALHKHTTEFNMPKEAAAATAATATKTNAMKKMKAAVVRMILKDQATEYAQKGAKKAAKTAKRMGLKRRGRESESKAAGAALRPRIDELVEEQAAAGPSLTDSSLTESSLTESSLTEPSLTESSLIESSQMESSLTISWLADSSSYGSNSASCSEPYVTFLENQNDDDKPATAGEGATLDLAVLLLDPASHRFELLQLEIAQLETAKVSDLLAHIPQHVTQPKLKKVVFDGILDHNYYGSTAAEVGKSTARIIDAFGDKDTAKRSTKMVLVARPEGASNADTLEFARPILQNKDVSGKLESNGFDLSGWKSTNDTSKSLEDIPKIDLAKLTTRATSTRATVALLLTDPASHRFELLQLEFANVEKAKVSDMLARIPKSVTEPKLKKVVFDGVLEHNYYGSMAEVCKSTTRIVDAFPRFVFVARPEGTSNADALELARPVLLNKDVSGKLESSGFDLSGWKSTIGTSKSLEDIPKIDLAKSTTRATGILAVCFCLLLIGYCAQMTPFY